MEDLEQKLLEYSHKAFEAGKTWAIAKEQSDILEKRKDMKFADIVSRQEGKSLAERERKALLTEEWDTYTANMLTAESERGRAKVKYDDFVRMWDTYRTLISSKNAERRFSSTGV